MRNFLALNRDLRTDQYGITALLDNVPSSFHLPDAKDECYYSFNLNYDMNSRGTVRIKFDSTKAIQVYVSDQIRKPQLKDADRIIEGVAESFKYTPVHNNLGEVRSAMFSLDPDSRKQKPVMEDRDDGEEVRWPTSLHERLQAEKDEQSDDEIQAKVLRRQTIYLTVKALEGPAFGKMHIKTEVSV